jgi:hypothetical protein
MEEREVRRTMAKASLHQNWLLAIADGQEELTDEDVNREIETVRRLRLVRRQKESIVTEVEGDHAR